MYLIVHESDKEPAGQACVSGVKWRNLWCVWNIDEVNVAIIISHMFQILKQAWNYPKMFDRVEPSGLMLCWLILRATPTPRCPSNASFSWENSGVSPPAWDLLSLWFVSLQTCSVRPSSNLLKAGMKRLTPWLKPSQIHTMSFDKLLFFPVLFYHPLSFLELAFALTCWFCWTSGRASIQADWPRQRSVLEH